MIKREGNKYILYSKDGSKKLGTFDSKEQAEEREKEIQRIKHVKSGIIYSPEYHGEIDLANIRPGITLTITKASLQDDGTTRWQAVTSDTGQDRTGEQTSLSLFQDWIERVDTGKSVAYLPPPRVPFLGLSHYPSLDGLGEAGPTKGMWVQGNVFKATGFFYNDNDHPLGKRLAEAVRKEQSLIKKGESITNPIRISAAWWDISHAHGDFIFERKSLTDKCPMCESGADSKVYLKGQLDHFAATRVPINPRTSLALEEKAMTVTRKDDATSIIEDEALVEEIDKQAKLTGKSETEELPDAMVVRADEEKAKAKKPDKEEMAEDEESEAAEGEEEEAEEDMPFGKKKKGKMADKEEKADVEQMGEMAEEEHYMPFGGAMSLKEAESFMSAQQQAGEVYSNWAMFDTVMRNILDYSEAGEMKGRVQSALSEFGDRIAAIKAAIEDVSLIEPVFSEKGVAKMTTTVQEVPEKALHPIDALKAEYDRVLSDKAMNREQRFQVLQEAFNSAGETIKSELDKVVPPDPSETIQKAMTPILEQLALIAQKLDGKVSAPQAVQPQQKSFTPAPNTVNLNQGQPQTPVSPVTGQPSKLTAMIRRSVGITQ